MKTYFLPWITAGVLLCISCGRNTSKTGIYSEANNHGTTSEGRVDLQDKFRNVLSTILGEVEPDSELQKALMRIDENVIAEPDNNSENPISLSNKRIANVNPSDLFYAAKSSKSANEGILVSEAFKAKRPVTMILIPGIISEFSEVHQFKDIFEYGGALRKQYGSKLDSIETSMYSLRKLAQIQVPLSKVVDIASIDSANQNPALKIISMHSQMGSMETIGSIEDSAKVFMERIDKVFKIIPPAERESIYFVGYSRGAPISLDILSHAAAQRNNHPWFSKVKGVISVAGVLYGAVLADVTRPDVDRPIAKIYNDVREIQRRLDTDSSPRSPSIIINNTRAISHFVTHATENAIDVLKWLPWGFKTELLSSQMGIPNISDLKNMFSNLMARTFGFTSVTDAVLYENILRIKTLLGKLLKGTDELTSEERLNWWKTHVIPSTVKYFSVSAVYSDGLEPRKPPSPLNNSAFYAPKLTENLVFRMLFYENLKGGEIPLNDGAVGVPESRFWPKYAQVLNPKQPPFRAYDFGALATNHSGIAYPYMFKDDADKANTFPRTAVLMALITTALSTEENL